MMGAHSYCKECGCELSRISLSEVQTAVMFSSGREYPIPCVHCGADRADDTESERMSVLVDSVMDIHEKLAEFEAAVLEEKNKIVAAINAAGFMLYPVATGEGSWRYDLVPPIPKDQK